MAPLGRPLTRSFSRRPKLTAAKTAAKTPVAPLRTAAARTFATAAHNHDDLFKHGHNGDRHEHDEHRGRRRHDPHSHHSHTWPACKNPTPYEVLGLHKTAAYQKKRFYALAKQYHPDLHHCTPAHLQGLTPAERLERYRLLVAANELLSHTGRRRMYDLYGQGWAPFKAAVTITKREDREWRTRRGTAAYNATWEDWERWRQENGGGASGDGAGAKQTEQFMSNGGFAVVVLVLVCIGGWGQMTRAGNNGASILEMREQQHRAVSGALRDRQKSDAPLSRKDRVGSFLERREGCYGYDMGMGLSPPRAGTRRTGD
ncbi:J domain-containing protein 1 [Sporothrix curviconia]|uniref:J domain-containing protein 1 n=1 Tax=Sporothrix curviconia TaxID=1260050 RepID=A0ABP0B3H4_9PEZI